MLARLLAAALGGWLMASPYVLGYSGAAANNAWAFGPLVVGSALVGAWQLMRPLRWVEPLVGAWLLAVPFVLYEWYGATATVNSLGVGLALIAIAFVGGKTTKSFGGGWKALLRSILEDQKERAER